MVKRNSHHILFYRKLHEANPDTKKLRQLEGFQVPMPVDLHQELHDACPGVPPIDVHMAQQVGSIIVASPNQLEMIDNYCFAVEAVMQCPRFHDVEKQLGWLAIDAIRLQLPYIKEAL